MSNKVALLVEQRQTSLQNHGQQAAAASNWSRLVVNSLKTVYSMKAIYSGSATLTYSHFLV